MDERQRPPIDSGHTSGAGALGGAAPVEPENCESVRKNLALREDQVRKLLELRARRLQILDEHSRPRVARLRKEILSKVQDALQEPSDKQIDSKRRKVLEPQRGDLEAQRELLDFVKSQEKFGGLPQDSGKGKPDARAEKEAALNAAIKEGRYGDAHKLNDELAHESLQCQLEAAKEAAQQNRQLQEAAPSSSKRPKLQWGMTIKERWERKGNM